MMKRHCTRPTSTLYREAFEQAWEQLPQDFGIVVLYGIISPSSKYPVKEVRAAFVEAKRHRHPVNTMVVTVVFDGDELGLFA